jgi:hypothetical protein
VAIDGTVVQAMGSKYKKLKREAAAEAAREAREAAEAAPGDSKLEQAAEQAELAEKVLEERAKARRAKGRDAESLAVTPSEPEAAIQPMKNKSYAPSYKPSVAVNAERVIVAQAVDPTSETAVFEEMLDQAERSTDEPVGKAMCDAGYFAAEVIEASLEQDVDLLVPEGKRGGAKQSSKQYPKGTFTYDEASDTYTCPQGHTLHRIETYAGGDELPGYAKYGGAPCADCPFRDKCTKSKKGRTIKRYACDEAKDALRQVMQQPGAQQQYAKRQAWVEPVFGELAHIQGLRRFRRRGLSAVSVEFSLHAIAHNVRRLLVFIRESVTARARALAWLSIAALAAIFAFLGASWITLAGHRMLDVGHNPTQP